MQQLYCMWKILHLKMTEHHREGGKEGERERGGEFVLITELQLTIKTYEKG